MEDQRRDFIQRAFQRYPFLHKFISNCYHRVCGGNIAVYYLYSVTQQHFSNGIKIHNVFWFLEDIFSPLSSQGHTSQMNPSIDTFHLAQQDRMDHHKVTTLPMEELAKFKAMLLEFCQQYCQNDPQLQHPAETTVSQIHQGLMPVYQLLSQHITHFFSPLDDQHSILMKLFLALKNCNKLDGIDRLCIVTFAIVIGVIRTSITTLLLHVKENSIDAFNIGWRKDLIEDLVYHLCELELTQRGKINTRTEAVCD